MTGICPTCNGAGKILYIWDKPGGQGNAYIDCPYCLQGQIIRATEQAETQATINKSSSNIGPFLPILDQLLETYEIKSDEFKPHASFNRQLDWLIWLEEDVGYVAKPLHPMVEILLHPQEQERIVGFKILGITALCKAAGLEFKHDE